MEKNIGPNSNSQPRIKLPRGVSLARNKKQFTVKAHRNQKHIYIGRYDTVEEADQAYKNFVKLNPPGKSGQKPVSNLSPKRKTQNDFRGTWLYGL